MTASDSVLDVHRTLGLFVEAVEEYAIFSLDRTGAVQTWNVGAQRIKGYTEPEILGRHFSVFYLPEDQQAGLPDSELAHATSHGSWSGAGWRVRSDGAQFWANVLITAVFDDDGELEGFVKVTRDETDRRIAEENDRQLDLILERHRMATELSEATVRGIFSAMLALDSAMSDKTDPRLRARIQEAVSTLEHVLEDIRSTAVGPIDIDLPAGSPRGRPGPPVAQAEGG